MVTIELKNKIISACHEMLEVKKSEALTMVANAEAARNNETKSSAGDKYETGRSMMQMEKDKAEIVLNQINDLQAQLSSISKIKSAEFVQHGSLVVSNEANYLIAIPLGKIVVDQTIHYIISNEAPLARVLLGKKEGDEILFLNRTLHIHKIY